MDLRQKVTAALKSALPVLAIQLEDDADGLHGYVVSDEFQGVSSLERQTRIGKALRNDRAKIPRAELDRIIIIAALSPVEYRAMGLDSGKQVKVSRVKKTDHPGQPSPKTSKGKQ
jgi:acid stress-induced BolA-like protein IbaG/YrbA